MTHGRNERLFRILYPTGLLLFGFIIWIGWPLNIEAVPGGILNHQSAGNAERVDAIQSAWVAAGLYDRALIAMFGDIVFITVFGLGSWYGGLSFLEHEARKVRRLGGLIVAAAAVFIATDYAETFSQIIQLWRMQGNDVLASVAATVRPVKIAAWLVCFIGIIAALVVRRNYRPSP